MSPSRRSIAAGSNRLGVQSFDDAALAALGRVHDGAQARAALAEASAVFETFNIDLMYALPGQSASALASDVREALAFEPPHLSIYQLTIEPNTLFARHPPVLPDEDSAFDMLDQISARCAAAGLERYEVSAYARPGHRCRHNLNYWEFGDYLGIGAGAHGKLTDAARGTIVRTERVRQPGLYLAAQTQQQRIAATRVVETGDRAFEFFLNALRLVDGFTVEAFEARTGCSWASVSGVVQQAIERGLLESRPAGGWRPTARGRLFLNDLQAMFLPGADRPH